MRKRKPRNKELAQVHALLDKMEIADGSALERITHWVRHRRAMFQASGHTDGCQCLTCGEANVVEQFWRFSGNGHSKPPEPPAEELSAKTDATPTAAKPNG